MKSLSLILNVILILAVAILYFLHFNGKSEEQENTSSLEEETTDGDLKVAYINADTVLQHFDFFKEKQKELEEKQKKLDQDYRNRAQGLQNEVNNYQQSMPNLTMGQARALEEDLMKKQQNLRVYQESLTQQLLQDEAKINQELYEKVTSYIKEYSEDKNIEMVVKYNPGSDVLYAGSAMDITREVISGLNKKYQEENLEEQAQN